MKKSAFTMIELVMVIVVLGILAALAMPRMERDLRQEAGDDILSAIRYTQHLALMDNKTDPTDPNWQREYWQIRFAQYRKDGRTRFFYTISTNLNQNNDAGANTNTNVDKNETTIDPANGKYMYHRAGDAVETRADESSNIFIGKNYGVDAIDFAGGCVGIQHIAFDHMGRPHVGIYDSTNTFDSYMNPDCSITFGFEGDNMTLVIDISRETGYAQIRAQNNS